MDHSLVLAAHKVAVAGDIDYFAGREVLSSTVRRFVIPIAALKRTARHSRPGPAP